ncbi:MAG: long-chain fatty acid--CoA ligase [Planctomycetaceae bacterium]|jgi:long-chain acyl-CoA synthetase|nr:long-chain fatty acid--CoA ligase [Planctomycetaceae bacterium]
MGLNLASCLFHTAEHFPDQTAVIGDDRSFTFAELADWATGLAAALREEGLRRGDHVLLLAPNVPEFTAVYYAVLMLGGVVVPVNTLFLPHEIADLLEHSDAKFIVCWHTLAEKGHAAFVKVDTCRHFFVIGSTDGKPKDYSPSLEEKNNAGLTPPRSRAFLTPRSSSFVDCYQTAPDDTAVILYTSGTTGKSKGVELSHFNLYSNALYTQDRGLFIQRGDVTVAVLPLFHTFGQTAIQNASIIAGAAIVMVSQFEPRRALAAMEKYRVTHIAAVPTMYNLMLQTLRRHPFDLSALRTAVSGGASLPLPLIKEFEEMMHFSMIEGYGLSETSPIACITPANCPVYKPGSIGPEFFGTQVRIIREDGSFADTNEVGELVIRGHNVMKGYYKDTAATAAAFTDSGWFRSGDAAKIDEDGYVFIVDRIKDVIIRAGMNIYPREIEELLYHHPAVLETAVIGVPDETLSENVAAFVTLVPGHTVTAAELQKYCRDHLALYKCPKVIEFRDHLPKNSTGKIMKRELRNEKMNRD